VARPEGRTDVLEGESRSDLMLNKVPNITLAFWIIKIMSTTAERWPIS
jgi:uncharacterized membrane-anchored protein